MMEVLGQEPDDGAEKELYKYLSQLNLEGAAWFNLDIPGINEIDCVAWFKETGFFVIEVKGFRIKDFRYLQSDAIVYSNEAHQRKYGHKPPPWKQAKIAARILATYLTNIFFQKKIFNKFVFSKNECVPFIHSTVYFPFISEKEFIKDFPNFSESLVKFIIFNDCHGNSAYLTKKLEGIIQDRIDNKKDDKKTNSVKIVPDTKADNFDTILNIYKEKIFLSTPEKSLDEKYDFKLLKLLESNDLSQEIDTIDFSYPIYRYGYAGTGKTVIALKILQHLALQEKNVLFTCYNKVLATDLKRFNKLSYNKALKYFDFITIKDIHDLIVEHSPFHKVISGNYFNTINDNTFNDLVDGIISSQIFKGVFEYIVIDEAQDFKDYGWKLLHYLAKDGENSLIVLNGKEQNLYLENPSYYLKRFEDNVKRLTKEKNLIGNYKQKRRIYRNQTRTFLFAHSFLDLYPEYKNAVEFIFKNESKKDNTIEYARKLGNFPYLFINESKNLALKNTLKKSIEHSIKENKNNGLGESGVLIIVPWKYSKKYPEHSYYRNMAVEVLREMGVDYLDYTIEENRRLDYLIDQVRIVSFHSCRGIETNFSIILGFEELFNLAEKAKCDYHKLGYIILSRAKFETYVFIDSTKKVPQASKFIEYSKNLFAQIEPDGKFVFPI